MNKRLVYIIGGSIFLLILTLTLILVNDNHLHELEDLRPPNRISSYQETGYFEIEPETILASLESGDTNVFTPLLEEDALDLEALTDLSIYWTQADFLKIASALGQFVWDDPMDLKDWSVYSIIFEGSCGDPIGLDFASITYFKMGRKNYTTRLIEIHPYFGWARWGDGEKYPQPILRKWKSVDLLGSKITADDALRIANEDAKARFQFNNDLCGVIMSSPRSNDPKNWSLKFFLEAQDIITYIVNLDTGGYSIRNPDK